MQWLKTQEFLRSMDNLSKDQLAQTGVNKDSLQEVATELQKELSIKSPAFRRSLEFKTILPSQVQQSLAKNEAAVDIISFQQNGIGSAELESYVALVTTKDNIKLAELGDASQVKSAVKNFREGITKRKDDGETHQVLWKRIDEHLKGINKIYLTPGSEYHSMNFGAVKDPSGKYLCDKYQMVLTTNTAYLPEIKAQPPRSRILLAAALGNPQYGKNGLIEPLPGTEAEVKKIGKILQAHRVRCFNSIGPSVTRKKVKELVSPGVLHLATHAYFLEDHTPAEGTKRIGTEPRAGAGNPQLRSGLLMSNCDDVFSEDYYPSSSAENGLLSAHEIATLNLDNTELTVLSSCNTGISPRDAGEGFYSLQKAFMAAGSKHVMMRLWKTNDEFTLQFLTAFYSSLMRSGAVQQAFTEAQKQLRSKYKDPFYWAAFVMVTR
jgi:CHAT domain-containing protein